MSEKTKKQVDPFDDDTEKMKRAAKRLVAMQQLMKAQTGLGSVMDQPKPPEQQPATPTPMVNRMANMPQPWAVPASDEHRFMPGADQEMQPQYANSSGPVPQTEPLGPPEPEPPSPWDNVKMNQDGTGWIQKKEQPVGASMEMDMLRKAMESGGGNVQYNGPGGVTRQYAVAPELVVGGRGGSGRIEAPESATHTETSPDPGSDHAPEDGRPWSRYLSTVKEWANKGEGATPERLLALEKRFPGVLKLIKKDLLRGISADESGYQTGMAMPGVGPSLTTDMRQDPDVLEAENERDLLRMSKGQRLLRSLNAETPMAKAMYDALDRAEGKRRLKR